MILTFDTFWEQRHKIYRRRTQSIIPVFRIYCADPQLPLRNSQQWMWSCRPCHEPCSLVSWLGWGVWIYLFRNSGHYIFITIDPKTPTALKLSY